MINNKNHSYIVYYLFILTFLLIFLTFFCVFYKYNPISNYTGQIIKKEDDYYVHIYVPYHSCSDIKNESLVIDSKKYQYSIIEIKDGYYLDDNLNKYYEVIIYVDLDTKHLINNNIIDIGFILNKTTLYQELKKLMKGWLI